MNMQQAAVYDLLNMNKNDLAALPEASSLHGELIKVRLIIKFIKRTAFSCIKICDWLLVLGV